MIALCDIVAGAKKLNVIRRDRCTALCEGQDVIKVKLISGTAGYAVSAITLPNLELH